MWESNAGTIRKATRAVPNYFHLNFISGKQFDNCLLKIWYLFDDLICDQKKKNFFFDKIITALNTNRKNPDLYSSLSASQWLVFTSTYRLKFNDLKKKTNRFICSHLSLSLIMVLGIIRFVTDNYDWKFINVLCVIRYRVRIKNK